VWGAWGTSASPAALAKGAAAPPVAGHYRLAPGRVLPRPLLSRRAPPIWGLTRHGRLCRSVVSRADVVSCNVAETGSDNLPVRHGMQTSLLTARGGPVGARSRRWGPCGAGSAGPRENPAGPNRAASAAFLFSTQSFHGCGAGRPNRERVWSRITHGSAHQDSHAPVAPRPLTLPPRVGPSGHVAYLTSVRLAGRGPLGRWGPGRRSVPGPSGGTCRGPPSSQTLLVVARTQPR